ncbi:imidazole glycerol phosphate synthase subunit HisH [Pseudomonas aeruginosa]|nr:imidazole glycerol phosphate synthase subunit HisH [Pseudomonas aeruginosa]MBG7024163.1 imidazole glycerol phosphate synthase subunit HisH [Pseudomonas aeruginosa]MBG7369467.1 imidazole glycerol phosphate synthase subunit HisH [Pseudomonas aeruginosa]
MITIIDYGIGNIQAFVNVYKRLHIPAQVARVNSDLKNVKKLVLPGVGSFDHAMLRFTESGMREAVEFLVKDKGIPVLGICVGMQMLADRSDEGKLPGLGWIPGHVRSFRSVTGLQNIAMPHMGWNDVVSVGNNPLFNGLEQGARFYFLHSFYFESLYLEHVAAGTFYGHDFNSAVSRDNIFGVQFHPEKSHHFGVKLLKNFAEL